MANQLSNTGIVTGQTVEALQVSQSVDAFTGAKDYDITICQDFINPDNFSDTAKVENRIVTKEALTEDCYQ